MFRDPVIAETRAAIPQAANQKTAVDSAVIDMAGFGYLEFETTVGAVTDTLSASKYFEFRMMESDDGTTWEYHQSRATGAPNIYPYQLLTVVDVYDAAHPTPTVKTTRYGGSKRYVKLRLVFVGDFSAGSGAPVKVDARLGNKRKLAVPA